MRVTFILCERHNKKLTMEKFILYAHKIYYWYLFKYMAFCHVVDGMDHSLYL